MATLIEAARQALEALEMGLGQVDGDYDTAIQKAIGAVTALRTAIEQAEKQEPVAWMFPDDLERFETSETFAQAYSIEMGSPTQGVTVPLYTTPPAAQPAPVQEPVDHLLAEITKLWGVISDQQQQLAAQRQWVGLTDEQISDM